MDFIPSSLGGGRQMKFLRWSAMGSLHMAESVSHLIATFHGSFPFSYDLLMCWVLKNAVHGSAA